MLRLPSLLGTADTGNIGLQFSFAADFQHAPLRRHSVIGTDRRCRAPGNIVAHRIRLGAGQQVIFCRRVGGDSAAKTDPGDSRLKSSTELLEDADLEWQNRISFLVRKDCRNIDQQFVDGSSFFEIIGTGSNQALRGGPGLQFGRLFVIHVIPIDNAVHGI